MYMYDIVDTMSKCSCMLFIPMHRWPISRRSLVTATCICYCQRLYEPCRIDKMAMLTQNSSPHAYSFRTLREFRHYWSSRMSRLDSALFWCKFYPYCLMFLTGPRIFGYGNCSILHNIDPYKQKWVRPNHAHELGMYSWTYRPEYQAIFVLLSESMHCSRFTLLKCKIMHLMHAHAHVSWCVSAKSESWIKHIVAHSLCAYFTADSESVSLFSCSCVPSVQLQIRS